MSSDFVNQATHIIATFCKSNKLKRDEPILSALSVLVPNGKPPLQLDR